MSIPQYKPLIDRETLAKEVSNYILSDGYLTEFQYTKKFEEEIAKFLNVEHCIVVNNGTISLSLALLAEGIKLGDKVIIPNITMFGTQSAIELIGAIPLLVDVDKNNLCLDISHTLKLLQEDKQQKIRAVIYVTLNGRKHKYEEYRELQEYCLFNHIALIEDNAQSFGSNDELNIKINCPNNGIGSFSFSMPKIITTGQGGCLVTDNDSLANKLRKLKDFGREKSGIDLHDSFGINAKFTEIQAICGLNQLKDINSRIEIKKTLFYWYRELLKDVPEIKFLDTNLNYHCPWFIDIYVQYRDSLCEALKEHGIGTRKIYPPLSSQSINIAHRYYKNYGVSYDLGNQGVWLPSSLDLTESEIIYICTKIKEFYAKS